MAVVKREFSKSSKGEQAYLYEITNTAGMKAVVSDFGATLVSLYVPDKDGKMRDIVWGCDDVDGYEGDKNPYFGATVGRIANRVGDAIVTINGVDYPKDKNDNGNCLHGGFDGYHIRMWDAEMSDASVRFSLLSPDGDQGLPGNFQISVTYILTEANGLHIVYDGVSDQDTYVSMTNHSYFNLNGEDGNSILNHELWINADKFTMTDERLIPTGEMVDVTGTAMDFRVSKKVGRDINADFEQLNLTGGYDHNWVIDDFDGSLQLFAVVKAAKSGRVMRAYTNLPGVQFYSANGTDAHAGKGGAMYGKRCALCLETQFYPDTANKPLFPSAIFGPDRIYDYTTVYEFAVEK